MQSPTLPVQSTAASTTVEVAPPAAKHWLYSPAKDFWLIHGGAGLIVLPLVFLSYQPVKLFPVAITLYALILGLPHLSATHIRLFLDKDCRSRFGWLMWGAPFAIMGTVAVILYGFNQLPYLILAWFCLQTWHANRQNFGIMRRYVRMAGSAPEAPVNRAAEALIELFPWAAVMYAALFQQTTYMGYSIKFPPVSWFEPIAFPFWGLTALVLVAYLGLEIRQLCVGKFVPGRFLCCFAGCAVNLMAWVVVEDISWGYLVVSLWHALQYITYVHGFRANPPAGAQAVQLPLLKHLGIIALGGLILYGSLYGFRYIVPLFAVFHLSLNFHHYLSDALIWRRPPAPKQA